MTQPEGYDDAQPPQTPAHAAGMLDYAVPSTPAPRLNRRGVIAGRIWVRAEAFAVGSAAISASILVPHAIGLFSPTSERPPRGLWAGAAFDNVIVAAGFGGLGGMMVAFVLLRPVFPRNRRRDRGAIAFALLAGGLHPLLLLLAVVCLRSETVLLPVFLTMMFGYPFFAAYDLGRRSR